MDEKRLLTLAEIANTKDEDIDFSDIPELDETFWQSARRVEPATSRLNHPAAATGSGMNILATILCGLWRTRKHRIVSGQGVRAEEYFSARPLPDHLKGTRVIDTADGPVILKPADDS